MANKINNSSYYKSIILNNIDFDKGYSLSNNWIGYFERNKKFKIKYMQEAIALFKDYFKIEMKNIIIATSFYIDVDLMKKNKYENIENELSKENYIRMLSLDTIFLKNRNTFNQQLYKIETTFRILFPKNENIIEQLSLLAMVDDNVEGHCFFILEKSNLIIYPHSENTGYGFIGINDKDNVIGYDFLKKVSTQIVDFNSYVR